MKNFMQICHLSSCCFSFRAVLVSMFLMIIPLQICARVLAKDYYHIVRKTSDVSIAEIMKKADSYLNAGHSDTALVYYMVVCNRMSDNLTDKDKQQCALAYLKKGNVFYMKGDYAGALSAYFSGLRIYNACKNQHEIGRFYNNIGNVYCLFGEYVKGLEYYRKGYIACHKYGDKANEYKTLTNMTGVNTLIGKTAEARRYYKLSEKIKNSADEENIFMNGFNFGLILMAEKNYHEAVNTYNGLLKYALDKGLAPRYICSAYKQLYDNHIKLGNRDSTLKYLRLCESVAVKNNILHFCLDVLVKYADYYDMVGNYKSASLYRARYQREKDSIFDIHEFEMVKNEQLLYEMNKYDKYISSLNAREKERVQTISRQRHTIMAVTFAAAVIGVLLLMVYRQKGRIDKSYNDLFIVNRNFVSQQEFMRQRMQELTNRLKRSESELAEMKATCYVPEENPGVSDLMGTDMADEADGKGKTLVINDNMRKKLLDSIIDVMENTTEFCSPDFSLARLASLIGSNSKYVSLVINDTFHKTFKNYVNEYRIRQACLRMSDTKVYGSYTLNAIAESVGFKSYTTFVELFRKVTGITPSMYKEKLKDSVGY